MATILVVDDEPEVREVIAEFLSDSGYRVVQAADGAEALRVLAETPKLDLIVSDVRMPGISGIELAERATRDRRGLKVILISGFFIQENVGRRLLRKPFRLQELDAAVRDELGH